MAANLQFVAAKKPLLNESGFSVSNLILRNGMESLPPTAYIAIGTLIAAFITGSASLINIVMSKEHKISELRQEWINDLRNDMSEYIAGVNTLFKTWTIVKGYRDEDENVDLIKYMSECLPLYKEVDSLSHKIQLRLNPDEHKEIIALIKVIEKQCADVYEIGKSDLALMRFYELNDLTQKLLKIEWERVKIGEGGFKKLKNTFIGMFIIPVIIGSFWFLLF